MALANLPKTAEPSYSALPGRWGRVPAALDTRPAVTTATPAATDRSLEPALGLPVDLAGIVRRRWPAMVAVAMALPLLAIVLAVVFPSYDDATARVLYNASPAEEAIEDRAISAGILDRSIENAIEVAGGDAVRTMTADAMRVAVADLPTVDVSTEPGTDVVVFTVAGTGSSTDAELANAWAESFLAVSLTESLAQIDLAIDGLEARRIDADAEGRATRVAALESMIVDLETERELIASGSDRIIAVAESSTNSSAPIARNLVFATAAGLFLAAGAGLVLDTRDRTILSAADLDDLDVPFLGSVRHVSGLDDAQVATATLTAPGSVLSDDHHRLRSAVQSAAGSARLIAVVSHGDRDGRTSLVTNLAAAFAEAGERTVVVDTDFRSDGIGELLRLGSRPGLVEWVKGHVDAGDIARRIKRSGIELAVVPTGQTPVNGPALLGSAAFTNVLLQLRAEADRAIFDTASLSGAADAALLTARADLAIVVARAGATTRDQLTADIDDIHRSGGTVAGVVLTGIDRPAHRR